MDLVAEQAAERPRGGGIGFCSEQLRLSGVLLECCQSEKFFPGAYANELQVPGWTTAIEARVAGQRVSRNLSGAARNGSHSSKTEETREAHREPQGLVCVQVCECVRESSRIADFQVNFMRAPQVGLVRAQILFFYWSWLFRLPLS